jgi:hypothetical protein
MTDARCGRTILRGAGNATMLQAAYASGLLGTNKNYI